MRTSDAVSEETMVDVCLRGMANGYCVFLENLTFPSFSKLSEAARRTNEYLRKTPLPSLVSRPGPTVMPLPRES